MSIHNSNKKGLELLSKHMYSNAISQFSRAIFLNPTEPSYYWHRAEAHLRIGDFEGSILNLHHFQHQLKNGYVSRKRLSIIAYTYGQCLLDQGRFQEAEKILNIALESGFDFDSVSIRLAVAKLGQGYAEESLEYLYPVINCHCIDADIYILRAKIYCQLGSVFLAIQDLRIAMDLNPGHPEISWLQFKVIEYAVDFKNKASEQILRNDFKTAIWFLNQAIELDPDDWKTLMIRGILLGEIDQYEAGITDLLQVLGNIQRKDDKEEDIKHYISILHNKAGVNFFDERQFSAALERFEIALNFNPDDILIRKNRAECFATTQEFEKSILDIKICLEKNPNDNDCRLRISDIYLKFAKQHIGSGHYEDAINNLTFALEYEENNGQAYFDRALCFFYLQKLESMYEDLQNCIKFDPKHQYALSLLSSCDKSREEFNSFPNLDPIKLFNRNELLKRQSTKDGFIKGSLIMKKNIMNRHKFTLPADFLLIQKQI